MLSYAVAIALSFTYLNAFPDEWRWAVFGSTFLISSIFPALLISLLIRSKMVGNVELTVRKERGIPYFIFIFSYLFCLYFLYRMHIPLWMLAGIAGACLSLIVAVVINCFWKISAHSMAIGGLTGGVMAISYILRTDSANGIAILILIAGLVGSSRLYLGRHTPMQVYSGFMLGFSGVCGALALATLFSL